MIVVIVLVILVVAGIVIYLFASGILELPGSTRDDITPGQPVQITLAAGEALVVPLTSARAIGESLVVALNDIEVRQGDVLIGMVYTATGLSANNKQFSIPSDGLQTAWRLDSGYQNGLGVEFVGGGAGFEGSSGFLRGAIPCDGECTIEYVSTEFINE